MNEIPSLPVDSLTSKIEKDAREVARVLFGAVPPEGHEWKTCMDIAARCNGVTDALRIDRFSFSGMGQTAALFEHCKAWNRENPGGTVGFLKNPGGLEVYAVVDHPAIVYPDPKYGDRIMAWFREHGWRQIAQFEKRTPAMTLAERLTVAGQQVKLQQNQMDMAEYVFRAAILADKDCWHAYNELGVMYNAQNKFHEAEVEYNAALVAKPDSWEVRNNRGNTMRALGRFGEAVTDFSYARMMVPGNDMIAMNLATSLNDVGRVGEALALINEHRQRSPFDPNADYNLALVMLMNGLSIDGWQFWEARLKQVSTNYVHYEQFKIDRWKGEAVTGKRCLVWTDQGVGDEVLTLTMLPDLIAQAAHVTFMCSNRLVPLVKRSFPAITACEQPSQQPVELVQMQPLRPELLPPEVRTGEFDVQLSMSDLGRLYRPDMNAFPAREAPLLKPDAEQRKIIRDQLQAKYPGTKLVGLSWSSKKNYRIGALKGLTLKQMLPILKTPGVTFVNLQYGDVSDELREIKEDHGITIATVPSIDPLVVLDGFASLVAAMDLVVTVSNSAAHFAGALGIPTWVIVGEGPAALWYWFRDRPDSPWYPSLRLFRHVGSERWKPPVKDIAGELAVWVRT